MSRTLLKLSVRALVEFTYHGEDIRPARSVSAMMEGMSGHIARQGTLTADWQCEVPLTHDFPSETTEDTIRISGRMDAFRDGTLPLVEEIKLASSSAIPEQPNPAHRAQAVVYAHILCLDRPDLEQVQVRLVYVRSDGQALREFTEVCSRRQCADCFHALFTAYCNHLSALESHRNERNRALSGLAFPYPSWRPGQRNMAVQVYTAIQRQRRLFASMPTGTGKSCATLYPALKALGKGLTDQIFYLTSRTTQRQGPLDALTRIRTQDPPLWTLVLDAKDRLCPESHVCHPDVCPRARGHFLRDQAAIRQMMQTRVWLPGQISELAEQYSLCPFEFALSLCEIADLVICDYNYALDPAVRLQRIFEQKPHRVTLLIDEAHHLPDRLRDMLSGSFSAELLHRFRREYRTAHGGARLRHDAVYAALTKAIRIARTTVPTDASIREGVMETFPEQLRALLPELLEVLCTPEASALPDPELHRLLSELIRQLTALMRTLKREEDVHAILWHGRKHPVLDCFCLDPAEYFASVTAPMQGVVCFSATLEPLSQVRTLLGGDDEDACFSAPSPFPPENLVLIQENINTRYQYRSDSAESVRQQIRTLWNTRPGHYLVFFPSFAYLNQIHESLGLPCQVQTSDMDTEAREAFLAPYHDPTAPCMSLCVLGGLFAEGIDLPGRCLDGVVVVSAGLPQLSLKQTVLQAYYQEKTGHGFLYAYMIPGIQKVTQAVGRVIRDAEDHGIALLLDDRFSLPAYRMLCPAHWVWQSGDLSEILKSLPPFGVSAG